MKDHAIDTMALVGYLQDDLPGPADDVFKTAEQNECRLLIPEIVLGEFVYISLKGRLKATDPKSFIREALVSLDGARYIDLVGMDIVAWERFLELNIPELHDRMICAIALSRDIPLITNDSDIRNNGGVEIVWD